ncbi:NAD-dependent epimerase/dehydratase family protein [Oligoflexia bacterium]|nr:NAD-dependent epimerase/dehydratase family protein [Oligoflexia bacterium]
MAQGTVLITGVSGEIGHSLIEYLHGQNDCEIVGLDLSDLEESFKNKCSFFQGSVLDADLIRQLTADYTFSSIYHLAGVLSTGGERNPLLAHQVNVNGSVNILEIAREHSNRRGQPVTFLFPSTIAVYGIESAEAKMKVGAIPENKFREPITIYGINKRYVEQVGGYHLKNYHMLGNGNGNGSGNGSGEIRVDFRCIRFPGIISADTMPTGGTSDYGPEMLHAAAQGNDYECFVRPDSVLPFIAMPDAVQALVKLANVPSEKLTQRIYNITSFSPTAADIHKAVSEYFPGCQITYKPDVKRQSIVDSWPADVDDHKARADWGWRPEYDFKSAFETYLVPRIKQRYGT